MSTIYPSIQSLGRGLSDRVFYLTGKTVTKTVAIDTLRLLDENGGLLKSIELTAKDRICPMEERHCNPDYCEYAKGHFDRVNDAVYKIITENNIITKDMIKPGAIVIDIGMNKNKYGDLCGDVDFVPACEIASYITPVPGGVGPMTITMLLKNTIIAASNQSQNLNI